MMTIRNRKDFWSGILFAAIGVFFIVFAQEHPLGSAARMGPAYFPTLLGSVLCALGALVALIGYFKPAPAGVDTRIEPFNWRILGLILGAVLVFSLLLEYLGLMLSLAAMIAIAAVADRTSRVKETVAMIVVLDLIAYVAFVYAIGMNVAVWPVFF